MRRSPLWLLAVVPCLSATVVRAEDQPPGSGEKAAPKLSAQVTRDPTPLPGAGTVALSYADVVERTRDSVLTVLVKGRKAVSVRELEGEEPEDEEKKSFDLYRRNRAQDESEEEEDERRSSGTGLVLTQDGLVVTNAHVIRDAEKVTVRLRDQETELPAAVIGMDTATDIALLRVDQGGLQAATLGDSTVVRPGDIALALGSPFGLEQTITLGIISATGRGTLGIIEGGMEDFIQTDAAINPGNSGGPLVDGKGRVIGINTARYWGDGIGFAVPVNLVLKVAEDLLDHGWVVRGYLGVHMQEVTPKLLEDLKLPKRAKGVIISAVEADHPAAKAGFLPGDLVQQINGRKIDSGPRFRLAMAGAQPGATATFKISRHGEEMTLTAILAEPPELAKARAREKAIAAASEWVPGLFVAEISRDLRLKIQLPPDAAGLIVTKPFEANGGAVKLAAGDQVVAINGTPVKNIAEAKARLEALKTTVLLLKISSAGKERFVAVPRKA